MIDEDKGGKNAFCSRVFKSFDGVEVMSNVNIDKTLTVLSRLRYEAARPNAQPIAREALESALVSAVYNFAFDTGALGRLMHEYGKLRTPDWFFKTVRDSMKTRTGPKPAEVKIVGVGLE